MVPFVEFRPALIAAAFIAALSVAPGVAASNYDGVWSVSIITDSGTCDRGYRYRIRIANGRIQYDEPNGPPITFSGQVSQNGQISVSVRRGEQEATGSGRLSGDSGTGRWSGRSKSDQCSGRWEAERRGA